MYARYWEVGFWPMIMLTTAPIVMYIVGMIREMKTENERRTVNAFLTNTAFSWDQKL